MKPKLQEAFPQYKLMTLVECLAALNWSYQEDESGFMDIKCDCGTPVKTGGWVGTEHAWCPNCKKGMQDMTCLLPAGHASAGFIDFEKYDFSDGKAWVPENIWKLS